MKSLRQVVCRGRRSLGNREIMVLSDVRAMRRHHPGLFALSSAGRRSVLNAVAKSSCNQHVPRSSIRPGLASKGKTDHDDPLSILVLLVATLLRYGLTASKWLPSFHIRPSRAASLRATATRARLGPRRFITFSPQLFSAAVRLTVVNSTLAAS
jgi:hypothetical protein